MLACSSWLREDRSHWHSQGDTHIQPDLFNMQTPNSPESRAGLPQASPSRPILSRPTGVRAGNSLSAKEIQQELRQRLRFLLLLSHPFHQLPPSNYHPAHVWVVGRREGRCIRAELSPLFPQSMHLFRPCTVALTRKQHEKAATGGQGKGPKFVNINYSSQGVTPCPVDLCRAGTLPLQTPQHGPGWLSHIPTVLGLYQFSGVGASLNISLQTCRMNLHRTLNFLWPNSSLTNTTR